MIRAVIALLAIAATPLLACPLKSVAVVQQAQFVAATPLLLTVPTYGASYQYPQQSSGEQADLLRQLLEEIRAMRADLRSLQQNVPATAANGQTIVENSCIKCHQPALAGKAGTDFLLVDGEGRLAQLSDREKARIRSRVAVARNMPPGKPLPPEQAKAVVDFLTQQAAPAAPPPPPDQPAPKLPPSLTPKEAAPMPKQEK
jgi:mono/diheme cytochrome c family protein